MKGKGIGLALGGGAARGLAHIGVLQVLTQSGIQVKQIAGTSIGALAGALFAADVDLSRLEQVACSLRLKHIVDLSLIRGGPGIIRGLKVRQLLNTFLRGRTFADLRLPLAVVATDLWTGEQVVFTEGSVVDAVLSSCAIPGVFPPIKYKGRLLVDGGLINRVPVQVVQEMGDAPTVAVDVGPGLRKRQFKNAAEVMIQALDIMQEEIQRLKTSEIDVYIRPQVGHFSPIHLYKTATIIEYGRQAALQALPEIQKLI